MLIPIELTVDVKHHIDLMAEQGGPVLNLRHRFEQLSAKITEEERPRSAEWETLVNDVLEAERKWSTDEPTALEEIIAARPRGGSGLPEVAPRQCDLEEHIAGGWAGRIAGCVLGKPVECLMRETDSRGRLKQLLQDSDEWPLDDFISERTIVSYWESIGTRPSWFQGGNPSLREYLSHAPSDDDLNYTIISLKILKEHGREFTPDDVLSTWVRSLPFGAVCTAEKIAYRNRVMGMIYPETATFLNPYREWIGAQIRSDFYGYVCPGRPVEAARMGWNDAACSHTKSGVYGAMWVSAAIAAAFVHDDPEAVIVEGLAQLPERCRFTEYMHRTVKAAKQNGSDFEATFELIESMLDGYHCVHAIPNACIVAAALIHGDADFGKVICTAVMGGYDTDCNGATAGSIAGTMLGLSAIDRRWIDPFQDTLHSSVVGFATARISDLVAGTVELARSR